MMLFPVAVLFRDQKPAIVIGTAAVMVADLKFTASTIDAEDA